jgi:hypothetical protein
MPLEGASVWIADEPVDVEMKGGELLFAYEGTLPPDAG